MIEKNPAQNLETPKIEKRMPKYLTLDDSKLLTVTSDEERNKERDYAIITLFYFLASFVRISWYKYK